MNLDKTLNRIAPYFMVGIALVLSISLIFFLFYIVFWGLILGAILYAGIYIKEKFFPSRKLYRQQTTHRPRTYDQED